ncbi:MAG: response regulator transcription factor [Bacteroidales bacterium]|jgi:two-component system response regulator NreC|nr:response regulator transcription factor [Bacteroidales bacterium]
MIKIGIYDRHQLTREAFAALIADHEDFDVMTLGTDAMEIVSQVKTLGINIIVFNLHTVDTEVFALIKTLSQRYERLRLLVTSAADADQIVINSIKAGARGFLDVDATRQDLIEAILTLRGGYDFYSKSISHLLVGRYISDVTADKQVQAGVEALSTRQIEILRLWGNNKSNREIADELFLSVRTVESHKNHIMQKLNLKTTVDMIKFGIRNNIISL